jgi:putative RNA 2'-phosphotransferase
MRKVDDVKLGKFLSLVLRHKPETIGITLDKNGWADVKELIEKVKLSERYIDMEILERIVRENSKKRYSFNEDKTKIRASQGHSIEVELNLKEITPPKILYHGTATRFLESIKEKGILKMNRQYVHLSMDIETTRNVGQRHGEVVILPIDIEGLESIGHKFYLSENKVWLCDDIPSRYILWDKITR